MVGLTNQKTDVFQAFRVVCMCILTRSDRKSSATESAFDVRPLLVSPLERAYPCLGWNVSADDPAYS